ncbi:MAG TPA: hypothetical protein VLH17_13645, partial [Candidatus Binatia bacterium]|nr:hypothetical protein [Candidatus Binatia bacterium]
CTIAPMILTSPNSQSAIPHAATSYIVCGGANAEIVCLSTRGNIKGFAFCRFFKQNLKLLVKTKITMLHSGKAP